MAALLRPRHRQRFQAGAKAGRADLHRQLPDVTTLGGADSLASLKSRARKKLRKVRITAIAPSLPIASQLGAIAVATTSAPSENSSAKRIQPAKRSQIARWLNGVDGTSAF